MPELPEVHTIIEDLKNAGLVNQIIAHVEIMWERTIAFPETHHFCRLVENKTILDIYRRGKYIIMALSDHLFLCGHLRMTGHFFLVDQRESSSAFVRLKFNLKNGKCLDFVDTRKFGRWSVVSDPEMIVGKIGPEPLEKTFSFEWFYEQIKRRRRPLKSLLLDQTFIAGLGNIYVDEALWEAQLHPTQIANQIDKKQAKKLFDAIVLVLQKGIARQGTTLGKGRTNYYRLDGSKGKNQTALQVFRREGQLCSRCESEIVKLRIAQRGTHVCPKCQKVTSL